MKTTVASPESWKRVIDIELPPEDVGDSFRKKLQSYRKRIKVPGFRPGKVPEDIVRSRYGDAIKAEVVDELVQRSYKDACKEHSINPVSQGKVSKMDADDGGPLRFSVELEVEPEVEIKGYDKLKIRPSPRKIKKSDVTEALDNLRERMAKFEEVDRPSKKGDFVSLEYQRVKVDGEEKSDVSSPQQPVELGAGKIKEFDKALIGVPAGETVTASFKFPSDYGDADLAGRKGEFEITVKKVLEKQLPEVDEEFLKKLGDFADEEALRARIEEDLQQQEAERARNEACNKAIDALIDKNPFDVAPSTIEQYLDYMHEESKRYERPGQPAPEREELSRRYRDTAIRALKRYRIIDYIARKENIKATQEEVDQNIRNLAERYGQPFETVKQQLRSSGTTNRIRSDIREKKTLDFLIGVQAPA